jgi:hypothetical protein
VLPGIVVGCDFEWREIVPILPILPVEPKPERPRVTAPLLEVAEFMTANPPVLEVRLEQIDIAVWPDDALIVEPLK